MVTGKTTDVIKSQKLVNWNSENWLRTAIGSILTGYWLKMYQSYRADQVNVEQLCLEQGGDSCFVVLYVANESHEIL